MEPAAQNTTFTAMKDGTAEDYRIIAMRSVAMVKGLPDRILAHLKLLEGDSVGYAVDRLTHSLQSATHAYFIECAEFCAAYDQNCFDPDYDTLPLEFFTPMLRNVFAQAKRSIYMPEKADEANA